MALATPGTFGAASARDLTTTLTGTRRDIRGRLVELLLLGGLALSLAILMTLLVDLVQRSWGVWAERPGDFLSSRIDISNAASAGIWQGIRGTVILCVIVAVVAFPLGIACAVYLEEYATDNRFTRLTRVNVRNLAGVPSIVYGLLGLTIFVKFLEPITNGRTVIAGGLTLAVLVLPIVIITTSEALRAVPRSIREGAFGVGATEWETVRHHVLPAATPGILTGTVLSLARAAGEAAPILLVGAATGLLTTGNQGLYQQITDGGFTALPAIIYSYARTGGEQYEALTAAASLALVVLVVGINAIAIMLRNRYARRW